MTEGKKIYEFGRFCLDTDRESLELDGANIRITRKMFETLNILVESSGQLVEKQELMERIWHDRFVEESNLTFNIKMLRKALGDSAASPTYIETVPRRGYRFIAEVRAIAKQNGNLSRAATQASIVEDGGGVGRYLWPIAFFAILLTGLIATTLFYSGQISRNSAAIFPSGFTSAKITDTGNIHHAVISPDGKYMAYASIASGRQSLWLRHLQTSSNTSILPPTEDPYYDVSFSRDSETVYFVRQDGQTTGLYRVPIFGGVPTKIAASMQGGISVLPDDKRVSYVRIDGAPPVNSRLFTIGVDGEDENEIQLPDKCRDMKSHAFSLDGRRLAMACGTSSDGSQEMSIIELDLASGSSRELSGEHFFHIADVDWLPNDAGLIFAAGKTIGDRGKIWQLTFRDGEIVPLTSDLTQYMSLSISDDMSTLIATTTDPDFNLYNQIGESSSSFRMLTQARDRFSIASDGKIVYSSDTGGNADIWIADADGSHARQLTNDKSADWEPLVSRDRRHVFFASSRTGRNEIWRMNIDGSDLLQITRTGGGFPRLVSPDGKYLYYEPALASGLIRVPVDGGAAERVVDGNGTEQALDPEGLRVANLSTDPDSNGRQIVVRNIADNSISQTFRLPEGSTTCYFLRWLTTKSLAYMLITSEGERQIWSQPLDGGKPRFVSNLGGDSVLDVEFAPATQRPAFIRGDWKHDAVLLSAATAEISRASH